MMGKASPRPAEVELEAGRGGSACKGDWSLGTACGACWRCLQAKPCTCHPSERPAECQRRYALTDCLRAEQEGKEAAEVIAGDLWHHAVPERIWLSADEHSGDVSWTTEPVDDPDFHHVEYVRATLSPSAPAEVSAGVGELLGRIMPAVSDPGAFAPGYGSDYPSLTHWQREAIRIALKENPHG